MRIVQLVERLGMGGLERMALDLAVREKAAGHQPVFYCLFDPGLFEEEAKSAGIPLKAFQKKPGFSFRTVAQMARELRRDNVDVVHTHNPFVHHYGAMAAFLARVPVVVNTRHGTNSSDGFAYRERYFKLVLPITDKVIFVSEDSSRELIRRLGVSEKKTGVILNGIPVSKFRRKPACPGSQFPKIRFGSIGRMVPVKAQDVMIDAFAIVAKRLPHSELSIVGGGPLMEALIRKVSELGLEGRVRVLPATNDPAAILSELDIFVLSSLSEGLPLVILEAMAAGLPIVSTRVGGIPEIAPEGSIAWYCDPGAPEKLADVMYKAATCADLTKMGAAATSVAADRYDLEQMFRSYEKLFIDLAGK